MESLESEIRLYRSGAIAGLVELARLHALAPPRAVEGDLRAPEIGDDYGDGDAAGPGLFVALVEGGLVVDFARLVFRGGEPSDAEGGPDCYSNASTNDDKGHNTASSGSTTGEEVDSDEALAALSLSGGGLLLDYEEEQWIDSSKWDGKGEEDCEGDAKGLVRGLTNSSRLAEDEGSSSQLEEALISKIPVKASSRLWRSWDDESSSGEEDLHLDQDKYDEEQKRACKAVQTRDDTKGGVEDLSSTPSGQSSTSSNRSEKDEQNQEQVQTQKHDNESGQADLNSTELGQSSSSHEQDQIRIDLRLWPSQKHVLIKFWSGGKWVFTKDCALVWLNLQDMPESTLKVDFSAPFATISGFRNADCIMDFEINQLDDSSQLLHDVMTLLKPSIRNFQIVKRVGGAYACKVFKCLLMGNKCALKSLTQETPWTLEPREVEIISNLKDTNVMVFYQAWIEPWAYKGEAEQEYLFIHLEFCPSTLKHALLSENLHWFPDKWVLFEAIVRIVHKLHEASVVHRDLKPDNIFLNLDMVVRVGDFGDACIGADELGLYGRGTSNLGTRYYIAPELNSRGKVTEKVDIYSLGVVMFDIFSKFETESDRALIFPKLSKQGPHDSWDGDRNLYYMMTSLEASDRPSASEILEYIHLHHSG